MTPFARFITAILGVPVCAVGFLLLVNLVNVFHLRGIEIVEDEVVNVIDNGHETYDVAFHLKNDKRRFYINRGLQYGLNMDTLKAYILHRQAKLFLYRPLIPTGGHGLIKIESGNRAFQPTYISSNP